MTSSAFRWWWSLVLGVSVALPRIGAEEPVVPIAEIRGAAPAGLASKQPVAVEGTVTYVNPHGDFVLQDESTGIFVRHRQRQSSPPRPGDRIRVQGHATQGYYSPIIETSTSRLLHHGELPIATDVSASAIQTGKWDCRLVQLRGVVQAVHTKRVQNSRFEHSIDLHCDGWHVLVVITSEAPADAAAWIDADVRVTGVITQVLNTRREIIGAKLNANSPAAIDVVGPPPVSAWDAPLWESTHGSAIPPGPHRIRLRGTVSIAVEREFFYLQWGRHGLRVQSSQPGASALTPGDQAEVSGFLETGNQFRELRHAVFRKLGSGTPPPVTDVTSGTILSLAIGPRNAVSEDFEGRVVRLQGNLLSLDIPKKGAPRVYVESDGYPVHIQLPRGMDQGTLRRFVPGSTVRVSGVCLLEFATRPPALAKHLPVTGFRLLLRGAEDLELLRTPSWWTPDRLRTALALFVTVAMLAGGWVLALRRTVAQQTAIIAETTARTVLHEERARMARELHDTLEQQLTGVRMQIETAQNDLAEASPGILSSLESAKSMLLFSQEEARRSIWNLRHTQLMSQGLAVALENLLPVPTNGSDLRLVVSGSAPARRLAAPVEFHLLRIAQEAVTNALKHSGASQIVVKLHFTRSAVTLSVEDDGQGFDPARVKGGGEGHFGLLGIQERANKIAGQVFIESQPGGGVRIQITAPSSAATPA